MSRVVTVFEILIASPADVSEERAAVRDAILQWNIVHGRSRASMLQAVGWETHATPEFGGRPQAILNNQIVDSCDALIGIFGSRIGSPTGKALSGTVEEIERLHAAGRPVMLYFGKGPPDPTATDPEQLESLRQFKASCATRCLFDEYASPAQLAKKLMLGLTRLADGLQSREEPPEPAASESEQRTRWLTLLKHARDKQTNVVINSPVESELQEFKVGMHSYSFVRRPTELAGLTRIARVEEDTFVLSIPFVESVGLTHVTVPFGQTEDIWSEVDGRLHVMLRRAIVWSYDGANLLPIV